MASGKAAFITLILSLLICEASTIAGTRTINPVDTLDPWDWRAYDWGPMVNGVAMRVITRPEIAYGEPLEMFIEFRVDNAQVPFEVRRWAVDTSYSFLNLTFWDMVAHIDDSTVSPVPMQVMQSIDCAPTVTATQLLPQSAMPIVLEMGRASIGHPMFYYPGSNKEYPMIQSYLVALHSSQYLCSLEVKSRLIDSRYWSGNMKCGFPLLIQRPVYPTRPLQLVLPVRYSGCDTCDFDLSSFETETISVRVRPVFWFGISSSTLAHDENIGAGPKDSVFFVEIPWTRHPVKSLDAVPHWTGIQRLVVYETPQWPGHMTESVQAGYKVLWKGIYKLERKYGHLTKLEKLSDSTDTAFISYRPEL